MKSDAPPIPLASVVVFPRWLPTFSFAIGALGTLLTVATLAAIAAGWQQPPHGEQLAAMGIVVAATAFAFVLGWALPRARIRPQHLFLHLQRQAPRSESGSRTRGLLILLAIGGITVGAVGTISGWHGRQLAMTVVNGLLLITIVGFVGAVRRHQHRQAVALFALYAEGALDPAAARTIDTARAADPAFDAAVRDYVRINTLVVEQVRGQA